MRVRASPVVPLLRIPRLSAREDQEASFREAMTALARASLEFGPPPLDAVDPRALEGAVHVAMERGFAEDLSWLEQGARALALYELSVSLPPGPIRRDVRRRVFSHLYEGNAKAFVPVATRIALGNGAPLASPTLRARVLLCLELAVGASVNAAPLALALVSRPSSYNAWLLDPSTQGLPARRGAALLYEQAAREAVFRYQMGDYEPKNRLINPSLRVAFERLLRDREPLVWRHAAIARGLLASMDADFREQVEHELDPELGISEWRRAGVSLVASMVQGDREADKSVSALLSGPLVKKDPGLPSVLALALPRLAEFELDRARALVERLAALRRPDVAIAVGLGLLSSRDLNFAESALPLLRETLEKSAGDLGFDELMRSRALASLRKEVDLSHPSARVESALYAYETEGAKQAYEKAILGLREATDLAERTFGGQYDSDLIDSTLLELDAAAFERPILPSLLLLGRKPGDSDTQVEPVERLKSLVTTRVLDLLEKSGRAEFTRESLVSDQKRLRALLHLVDTDAHSAHEGERPAARRLERAIVVLVDRLAMGAEPAIHRILCAALARCFDAAVRDDVRQAGDLLLVVFSCLSDPYAILALAEASTAPDLAVPLAALARFVSADQPESIHSSGLRLDTHDANSPKDASALAAATKVLELSQGLTGGGYLSEALRRVFFRMGRSLECIATASSLTELIEGRGAGEGEHPLAELTRAVEDLTQMMGSALLRTLGRQRRYRSGIYDDSDLQDIIARSVDSGEPPTHDELAFAIESLVRELPDSLARAVEEVTFRLYSLPRVGKPSKKAPIDLRPAALPEWLLPRRTIGSFYVLRALGSGGASSVFVARRVEERNNPNAESFALKVPDYDPSVARSMSEQEFFQLFKDEAGALLSLPAHPNLARFVTFDLAARPKPILVMELIRGIGLDRLIRSRSLTMARVAMHLDSILKGLEVMHAAGLGHLDVKPSNVILRDGKEPVLVDFGLSGRKIRHGCGTVEYAAPEILGVIPDGHEPLAPPADIYAFGALAYELITGQLLFSAPDEYALVAQHVSHDGWLAPLAAMDAVPGAQNVARVIGSCLRQDPRKRPTATILRTQMAQALEKLTRHPWPLTFDSAIAEPIQASS